MKSKKASGIIKHFKGNVSRDDRYNYGRSLREQCPVESHASLDIIDRINPIDLHRESDKGRMSSLLPIRYERMMESPFTFFRGSAGLMAADLSQLPSTKMYLQACGDCHLLNFGGFATPERKLVFDINDFDETSVAPWEWDIKRLASSFAIAGINKGFTTTESQAAAFAVANSYRIHMSEYAEMSALQIWYSQINLKDLIQSGKIRNAKQFDPSQIKKAIKRQPHVKDFTKLVYTKNGKPAIKDFPPLIYHFKDARQEEFSKQAESAYYRYLKTLPNDRRTLLQRYSIYDTAIKVVGVGSVGTQCGIMLLLSATGDPLFLQFKEAKQSVLEPFIGKSMFSNHGQRVVEGQKLMQSASDIFLGWTHDDTGKQFYIRQLRDAKVKPLLENMEYSTLLKYAHSCGWALARAHARTGDPAIISGYIGNNNVFEDAISQFSMLYMNQNNIDYLRMKNEIEKGI
ncbi:DUF2252 domain-containing protein [Flavobacterium sp. DG1-102-2]|uniref:DUF2252 domain-containing protein n=1 Tax=Flavobacterium sp. DG1-102-2 TaxID=3081663 RepID=UPI002948FC09|nr:DUF2252 domain-containing protein [Flavobacterium sp. DG1-102-2]MDV6167013.1 DUF2252 domain-containing protein [Flavobacterium sp. DG1-102-2]